MLTICVHRLTCSDKNWSPASKSANSKPPLALPILRYSWRAYHPNLATLSPPAFVLVLRAPAAADPSPLRPFTFARPLANRSLPPPTLFGSPDCLRSWDVIPSRTMASSPSRESSHGPWTSSFLGASRPLLDSSHTRRPPGPGVCVVMDWMTMMMKRRNGMAASRRTGTGQTSSRRCPSTSAPISSRSTAARTSPTDRYTWCVRPSLRHHCCVSLSPLPLPLPPSFVHSHRARLTLSFSFHFFPRLNSQITTFPLLIPFACIMPEARRCDSC